MAVALNRMLTYLRELASSADRVAQGDLTVRIDMEGQVAEAFNRMVEGQRVVVRQLAEPGAIGRRRRSDSHLGPGTRPPPHSSPLVFKK